MKMAGGRWFVPPAEGLLLCVLALHLCVQDPLASADHTVAANASVANASLGPANASVASASMAPTSTSVASTLVAPTNTSVAPARPSVGPASASVVSASMAPTSTSVASTSVANASVAPTSTLVAPANTSVNHTEETQLTCQHFQCSGERCYQDEAHANKTSTCQNETHCELYRFSSMNYTARCSSGCGTEMCRTNRSVSRQLCSLDCCNSSLCLQLNASSYGDLLTTTAAPTTTTTRAPPRNGKVCTAFSCHGDRCFKGKKTLARCIVGQNFCEMKKTGLSYVAGCSRACKAAKPVCTGGMKAACYQECCPATLKASCLKLDGKVHVNSAGKATLAPLLKLVVCGVVLLLSHRGSASLWGEAGV